MARRRTRSKGRTGQRPRRGWAWGILAAATVAALLLAIVVRPALLDRGLHPGRHAVSGAVRLPLDRYVGAARDALGERIGRLELPSDTGPVLAIGWRTVWLDPPTARVLGVSARDGIDGWLHAPRGGPAPMAAPAQPLAIVVAHARAQVRGGRLAAIDWPTARNPDWTVTFAGGGRSVAIKVADDTGAAIAAPAR